MIIRSPFRDYYDYVAHLYGGGDPNIVYPRIRIRELVTSEWDKTPQSIPFEVPFKSNKLYELPDRKDHNGIRYEFAWLIIAGRYFPLCRKYQETHLRNWRRHAVDYSIDSFELDTDLVEFTKSVGHPVFIITGIQRDVAMVSSKCPHLASLGEQVVYSAEQIYQDLSYFIGNILHPSPDMMSEPDPEMTNKERLLSHGFDVKQSFRYRK